MSLRCFRKAGCFSPVIWYLLTTAPGAAEAPNNPRGGEPVEAAPSASLASEKPSGAAEEPDDDQTAPLWNVASPFAPQEEPDDDAERDETGDAAHDPNVATPGDPWGDSDGLSLIAFRAIFQTRYRTTFAEKSRASRQSYAVREDNLVQNGDGWALKRVYLRLSSDPVKYVGFKTVVDFAELLDGKPDNVLKQSYLSLRPIPRRLEFMVGQFKAPFSILELDPTSRFEFTDFGPSNELLGALGMAGRDLGIQLLAAPLRKRKRLQLMLGAFQGHARDEHDFPAAKLAARIEVKPIKSLRLGVDAVRHLRDVTFNRPFNTSDKDLLPAPPDPLYPAQKRWGKGGAYGIDARYKRKGLMIRGEAIYGDRIDIDERYGARHFWSAWGLCAYRFKVGRVKLMPAIRAEWLDADAGHGKGLFRTLSASLTTIAWSRLRFVIDVTRTDVEAHTPVLDQPKPLQADPYLALDHTRLTAQLQLEL